jgi:hypothetical protein
MFANKPRLAAALALALIACHGTNRAPKPLPSIDLPKGADLKPWSASSPSMAFPQAMVQINGKIFLALGNLSSTDQYLPPAGPGMLVGLVPSTGAQNIIDLGGSDGHQCVNPYALVPAGSTLYVGCTGSFTGGDVGRGIVEVDTNGAGKVNRFLPAPSGFLPGALALVGNTLWVGDGATDSLMAVDRGSFAITHQPNSLSCPGGKYPAFIAAALGIGNDVFVLCSSTDGLIVKVDAGTGAVKGEMSLVGAYPVALVQTGDNRIAVANSASATVTLVTPTATGMNVQRDLVTLSSAADLEDIRAYGQFLYLVSASTQTVTKVDISAAAPKIVDEVNVNPNNDPGADPARLELLDADQAVVADSMLAKVYGVQFTAAAK